jgi:L-ribulokinase
MVFNYPSGEMGILLDEKDPHVARQNPQDYLDGLVAATRGALAQAAEKLPDFDPSQVVGIGVDTTGSTPIPVDHQGTPLGLKPEFRGVLAAQVWLWKDHTAHAEAAEITARASEMAARIRVNGSGARSCAFVGRHRRFLRRRIVLLSIVTGFRPY